MIGNYDEDSIVVSSTEPIGKKRKRVWLQKGKNLFNKDDIVEGFRIGGDGTNYSQADYFVSNYIEVKGITNYIANYTVSTMTRIAFYDENKNFISAIDNSRNITTTENTCYIRLGNKITDKNAMQIEQGTTVTEYEEYVEDKIYIKNNNDVYEEFKKEETINITTGTEYATNEYIDGKQVFRKRFATGALKNNDYTYIQSGLANVSYIKLEGYVTNGSSVFLLPHFNNENLIRGIEIYMDNNVINIKTGNDRTAFSGYVDLYYTKN